MKIFSFSAGWRGLSVLVWPALLPAQTPAEWTEPDAVGLTHGPMLGGLTETSVRVWTRMAGSKPFQVAFSELPDLADARLSDPVTPGADTDFTGWVELTGLKPGTRYHYSVTAGGRLADTRRAGQTNSFRTLPATAAHRHPELNPRGLFNFGFEVGSCNQQFIGDHRERYGTEMDVVYATMLERLRDRIHFQIFTGDFIYEEAEQPWRGQRAREVTAREWAAAQGVDPLPRVVELAEGLTGVWENYKLYLSRAPNLAAFHREVPVFAMFDDHEIYNDVLGAGQAGLRTDARRPELAVSPFAARDNAKGGNYYSKFRPFNKTHEGEVERSVFRDPALRAWRDYLGWANPDAGLGRAIHFGQATLQAGSDILHDDQAEFDQMDLDRCATLHVQWGFGGTGVYEIKEVIDRHRLRLHPAPAVTETARYSIGAMHHTRFRISNCDFFILDTRSHRTLHNAQNPHDPATTMLGRRQYDWLAEGLRGSDADFIFIASSVSFMVPHDNGESQTGGNKDESWTAHAAERDRLLDLFESLDKPVLLMTGDIHNSMVVRIAPKVWEFLCGPHLSNSHSISDMADIPLSGPFVSRGRPVTVRWGTGFLGDTPRMKSPKYAVVQINNAVNSPDAEGNARWMAYAAPQVVFQFYDGVTGELLYAESVTAGR